MDYKALVEQELEELGDYDRVNRIGALIEMFSRDMPAWLAELRVTEVRQLVETHPLDEIQEATGIGPSRVRKLLER